jgi:hypothetical protein
VAIVLAANISLTAMPRSTRPHGMAGIDAVSKVAFPPLWMIVRDVDVANGRMRIPIKKNRSMNPMGLRTACIKEKFHGMTSRSGSNSKFFTRGNFNAAGTPGKTSI